MIIKDYLDEKEAELNSFAITVNAKYEFAGKTGTAQVISIAQDEEYDEDEIAEEFQDHALFIAFAPVESPRIAVAIIVENGGGSSKAAAPIARKMFDDFMSDEDVSEGSS